MDNAIRSALRKQRELKVEIDKLEQFIRTYEELTGSSIPRDELAASVDFGDNSHVSTESREALKKRRNNIKKLLEVSERLINEAKRPLTRTEIAAGMARLNVSVHASDVPKYLGTLLWRNPDKFVSSDGDGYMTQKLHIQLGQAQEEEDRRQEEKPVRVQSIQNEYDDDIPF